MTYPHRPIVVAQDLGRLFAAHEYATVVDQLLDVAMGEGVRMSIAVAVRLAALLGPRDARDLAEYVEARMK